ncbi:MAG: AEC family transporter [Clostridia bacterium]|nr:AEC family transporter [Clostridia bacterium]
MTVFFDVANQMLFLFICIMVGFAAKKLKVLPENSGKVISKLETYIIIPALVVKTFIAHCTFKSLAENAGLIIYCAVGVAVFAVIAHFAAPLFTKNPENYGIYRYSLTISNYGFMGNAVVMGLFGDEMLYRYLVFHLPATVFVYTVGMIWLTAGKKKFSFKMLINPGLISTVIGIALGLSQITLPSFVTSAINSLAACYSPLSMILTGFVIAGFNIPELLKNRGVYVLSLLRLIVIPLAVIGAMRLINAPADATMLMTVLFCMPLGLNTIVIPAAYGGDEKPGASMALISNVLALVTVPLMLSLVL